MFRFPSSTPQNRITDVGFSFQIAQVKQTSQYGIRVAWNHGRK